jgi:hypothetical protein
LIFLSYADEDRGVAAAVVAALESRNISVYNWREHRGTRIIDQMQSMLNHATAYLALMSPNFQAAPWCRRELHFALVRDNEMDRGPDWPFVYVLAVGDVSYRDAGFMSAYDWLQLDELDSLVNKLAELSHRFPPSVERDEAGDRESRPAFSTYAFRNRQDELERVSQGLQSLGGSHFWLVIAPPQLGKSYFISEVATQAANHPQRPWTTRLVNLREWMPEWRNDVRMILGHLFGKNLPVATGANSLARIAHEIIGNRRQHLCVLDSAELLDRKTAAKLRSCISQIYDDVRNCGDVNVKLALIVASRRDDEWRGVTPIPRLEPVRLTEFKQIVIEDSLRDLEEQMGRSYPPYDRMHQAALVQDLSEGLPALLVASLNWIREDLWVRLNQWVRNNRPAETAVFAQLAYPYVEKGLLSQDSLMPGITDRLEPRMVALEHTLRVLAPYRFFTQSHLRYHLTQDQVFSAAIEQAGWELEDLGRAISGTALLSRPLNEPWQALDGTVRRLLFRYYYRSDADKIGAHQRARNYVEEWVKGQTGTEQVVGLVECLWHEATTLGLTSPEQIESALCLSAQRMFGSLQPSSAYSETELRSFGARRIREDDELAGTLSIADGLLDKLADIAEPRQEL